MQRTSLIYKNSLSAVVWKPKISFCNIGWTRKKPKIKLGFSITELSASVTELNMSKLSLESSIAFWDSQVMRSRLPSMRYLLVWPVSNHILTYFQESKNGCRLAKLQHNRSSISRTTSVIMEWSSMEKWKCKKDLSSWSAWLNKCRVFLLFKLDSKVCVWLLMLLNENITISIRMNSVLNKSYIIYLATLSNIHSRVRSNC